MRNCPAIDLRDIKSSDTNLYGQAEAEFLTWLNYQTNIVSLQFPLALLPDNDTTTRHLSMPMLASPTAMMTQDMFTHAVATLLPNLTTPPRLAYSALSNAGEGRQAPCISVVHNPKLTVSPYPPLV